MAEWITNTMNSLGYLGIGLLMFLENIFPPIPSELIMPLAGFTVAQGKMNLGGVLLAGVVGTMVGTLPWYYAGQWLGESRLRRLADRHGKWLALSGRDIDQANDWFQKHGARAVLLCRLVPGVRTVISLPAGISQMSILAFLLYSFVGTTAWIVILTALGYFLGNNYHLVEYYLGAVSRLVLFGLAGALGLWIFRRSKKLRSIRRRG
ncbi:DedA family protein [Leptothermofonsia sichuanensis E412]|jgi:membrane protein DedA with SNARE-associated domain|uniref:DedA family protein n=1 Tax=Leptothermofonsia sichuanensis TaxID=2917832 RepID=UPI001CA710C0|nr:DedA family protein [Leptothermofonsia sichuanensis]QZZ20862.1 DedA family protein [Leptothermofonsia sichuanensis E412]